MLNSTYNVGAAFRIADAFLLESVYLCDITAQPPHRGIHKTTLGAEETVAWTYAPHTPTLLAQLQALGYIIVAVEQTDTVCPPALYGTKLRGMGYTYCAGLALLQAGWYRLGH